MVQQVAIGYKVPASYEYSTYQVANAPVRQYNMMVMNGEPCKWRLPHGRLLIYSAWPQIRTSGMILSPSTQDLLEISAKWYPGAT